MIRVLIAEDEPPTMRRIKRLIEQADPAFRVVATAADGEEALRLMEASACDVVFTDIRMPVIDGLQLMDTLGERFPDCQVVIISGYKDFTYVTHAVRASAVDYLLKPVAPEDMAALAVRLKKTYSQQKKDQLTKRLSATINRTEAGKASGVPPTYENARFCVCLFCAGSIPLSDDAGLLMDSAELEQLSLEDALHAAIPAYGGFTWAFVGNTPVERILICQRVEGLPAQRVAAELSQCLQSACAMPVSCVYAADSVSLVDIGNTIGRLRKVLLASVTIGKSVLIPVPTDNWESSLPKLYNDHHRAKALAEHLQGGRLTAAAPLWQELSVRMEQEAWTQDRIYSLFFSAFAYVEANRGATEELAQARNLVTDVLSTAATAAEMKEGLLGLTALFGAEQEEDAFEQSVAARVEQYLMAHYAEHINNQTLGLEFGYVPSYISLLFRKAYEVSPAEYLMRLRLDTAKTLMRENPSMLIRDIAERVGFKSPHHFSRIFKKHEGVWPTGYPLEGEENG